MTVNLDGTPEQIRNAYRQVIDALTDLTDILGDNFPDWNTHLVFDVDQDWRKSADFDEVRTFLHDTVEGFIDRDLTGRVVGDTIPVHKPTEAPYGSM